MSPSAEATAIIGPWSCLIRRRSQPRLALVIPRWRFRPRTGGGSTFLGRPMPTAGPSNSAEQQLRSFISKFEPQHQATIRAARRALRKRFPTANELAYDNYNFFVIGYGATERPSDCFVSIAAAANGVGLCFLHGASLPDPAKVLIGSGKQVRFVRVPSVARLAQPEIQALLSLAAERARAPLPATGRGKLIIRSISAKQRPRRRLAKA